MEKVKATRRLFNINFEHEGAHVALVGKHQGGAANGHTTLLTKATNKMPEVNTSDVIKNALEQVQVNLSMEEFLVRFFDMYHSDAERLTKLLGMETEYEAWSKSQKDMGEEEPEDWHQKYLEDSLKGINLMKSLNDGELDSISELDYLAIIKYQHLFETNGETMDTKDLVKKSLLDDAETKVADLTKSLDEVNAKLAAAEETIATFKSAEAEQRKNARMEALKAALPEDQVETTYKSLENLDDDAFNTIVKQFGLKADQEAASEEFVEKGVEVDPADDLDNAEDTGLLELIRKNKKQKSAK